MRISTWFYAYFNVLFGIWSTSYVVDCAWWCKLIVCNRGSTEQNTRMKEPQKCVMRRNGDRISYHFFLVEPIDFHLGEDENILLHCASHYQNTAI